MKPRSYHAAAIVYTARKERENVTNCERLNKKISSDLFFPYLLIKEYFKLNKENIYLFGVLF